jgi:hypothetical protein
MDQRKYALFSLLALIFFIANVVTVQKLSAHDPTPPIQITAGTSSLMKVGRLSGTESFRARENGEVTVSLPRGSVIQGGKIYYTTVTFRNFQEYEAAVQRDTLHVGFEDLSAVIYRQGNELVVLDHTSPEKNFDKILESTTSTICAGVVLRGVLWISEDLPMVIDLRVQDLPGISSEGPNQSSITEHIKSAPPDPACQPECEEDVFEQCPTYALFGCSGTCTTICQNSFCKPFVYQGMCQVLPLVLLPDLCHCDEGPGS